MKNTILIANWKMHGSDGLADALLSASKQLELADLTMIAALPYVYLSQAKKALKGSQVALGAQNVSHHPDGPHMGEISASMLKEMGCTHVIVGHSERRLAGEDAVLVAKKAIAAAEAGLKVILCVGENEAAYDQGETYEVLKSQLVPVFANAAHWMMKHVMIAYEPVWAIGTGKAASPERAHEVASWLRTWVQGYDETLAKSMPILYGGSVNPDNVLSYVQMAHIDGILVGGASLKIDLWNDIVGLCKR